MRWLGAVAISVAFVSPTLAADRVQEAMDALRADHGFPRASVAWTGADAAEREDVRAGACFG